MLIRVNDNTLREFPDELAAIILTDPSCADNSLTFTAHEVNVLIHGIFGTYYDPSISYEKNIDKVRKIYLKLEKPTEEAYLLALEAIASYNHQINQDQIGLVNKEELFTSSDSAAIKKIT